MQFFARCAGWSFAAVAVASAPAGAFGIFGTPGLQGGARWDAAPRTVDGVERSLVGGLRYSVPFGSYEQFRNLFTWSNGLPSVDAFHATVDRAFAQWTVTDPATGLGTNVTFVPDSTPAAFGTRFGAEIDLFGLDRGYFFGPGQQYPTGETHLDWVLPNNGIELASGTTGYPGYAMAGIDIVMNSNKGWTLPLFETVLTHEIGHALGLDDVERAGPEGRFIDDDFSCPNRPTCAATLSNSFAAMIDPYNPAASPLHVYYAAASDPGVYSAPILMQSYIPNEIYADDTKLQNDDFAGRQFLYPFVVVPEPASLPLAGIGLAALAAARRDRRNQERGACN